MERQYYVGFILYRKMENCLYIKTAKYLINLAVLFSEQSYYLGG